MRAFGYGPKECTFESCQGYFACVAQRKSSGVVHQRSQFNSVRRLHVAVVQRMNVAVLTRRYVGSSPTSDAKEDEPDRVPGLAANECALQGVVFEYPVFRGRGTV